VKKEYKKFIAIALMMLLIIAGVFAGGQAEKAKSAQVKGDWGNINWKQFAGKEINVLMTAMPVAEVYKKVIPDFETLTGIKVNLELLNDTDRRNKQIIDFSSHTAEYDVGNIGYSNREEFAVPGYLEPLGKYLDDSSLTDKNWYDFSDYPKGVIAAGYSHGKLVMIPFTAEYFLLWYRKDIFAKLDLKIPSTLKELETTAEKLNTARKEGKISEYAWIDREAPGSGESGWNLFCTSYRFNEPLVNFKKHVNYLTTKGGLEVLEYYTSMIKRFAPPGTGNWSWNEIAEAFKTKKIAMTVGGNASYKFLEDPKKSQVAGLVGYAPPPMAAGGKDPLWVWAWGINADSKKKDAAWLFVEWATSKTLMKEIAPDYGVPARKSIYKDPDYIAAMPSAQFVKAQQYMMTKGIVTQHGLINKDYGKVADIVSRELSYILAGIKTVKQAASDASDELEKIGYGPGSR